jgi:hypothetical protein
MAVSAFTSAKIKGFGEKASLITWSDIPTGNTGAAIQNPTHADRSVQVAGTFGGSTVIIQGSNNSTNGVDGDWVTLTDPAGAALSFTSTGLKQILQVTKWVRPSVSGGAAAAIDVDLLMVRKS